MKFCLFSYSDNERVYNMSYTSFVKYSNHNNYDFIPFTTSLINNNEMKPHWNKLLYAIKLLKSNNDCNYFVWFDHDIIIKNFNITLETIVKDYTQFSPFYPN